MSELKNQIHSACLEEVDKKIAIAQEALNEAILAGNEETKSSAGDKFETGRAMMQMEQDKHRGQLYKLQQLKNELEQLDLGKTCSSVSKGAFVVTSGGAFFISIGLGKLMIEGSQYFVISPEAPLAQAMMGMETGAVFYFQNREYRISEIV